MINMLSNPSTLPFSSDIRKDSGKSDQMCHDEAVQFAYYAFQCFMLHLEMETQFLFRRFQAVVSRHDSVRLADAVDQSHGEINRNVPDLRTETASVEVGDRLAQLFRLVGFPDQPVARPAAVVEVASGRNPDGDSADLLYQGGSGETLPGTLAAAVDPEVFSIPFRHGGEDFQRPDHPEE